MSFIVRTFGVNALRRDQLITRGPRFQIAFDANAHELAQNSSDAPEKTTLFRTGYSQSSLFESAGSDKNNSITGASGPNHHKIPNINKPTVSGRYELQRCKVDSVSLGVMPGRRVAAVRWEGVAEGITFVNKSVQEFKNSLYGTNIARNSSSSSANDSGYSISVPGSNNQNKSGNTGNT